jgi:hypothetical protein
MLSFNKQFSKRCMVLVTFNSKRTLNPNVTFLLRGISYPAGFPCVLENLFSRPGNVLEFYKVRKCPGKNIA